MTPPLLRDKVPLFPVFFIIAPLMDNVKMLHVWLLLVTRWHLPPILQPGLGRDGRLGWTKPCAKLRTEEITSIDHGIVGGAIWHCHDNAHCSSVVVLLGKTNSMQKSWVQHTVTVLWREEGYTMKYCLSPKEIPRAEPEGFPEGSGNISLYTPTRVTIQSFSIT